MLNIAKWGFKGLKFLSNSGNEEQVAVAVIAEMLDSLIQAFIGFKNDFKIHNFVISIWELNGNSLWEVQLGNICRTGEKSNERMNGRTMMKKFEGAGPV